MPQISRIGANGFIFNLNSFFGGFEDTTKVKQQLQRQPKTSKRQLKTWWDAFASSRDVIFRKDDPLPALLQLRSILFYLKLARRENISPLEASTFDIEWNG